ncbi:MAG TPA: Holliday junction branch migration protein RuvA [Polyangiaceae bacterium]|jgi:Holliday junction DNA helicase RuvA
MIGRLRGKILTEDEGSVILDVSGVGYELATPSGAAARAERDEEGRIVFHVHPHVREDAFELFGFCSEVERRIFRLLISVPNVGPKTALGVLSALPPPELVRALRDRDLARLCKVPGIGKKTAERLLLELKEKLPLELASRPGEAKIPPQPDAAGRLVGTLTNMGWGTAEAERAVQALGARVGQAPLAELLREALATLTA